MFKLCICVALMASAMAAPVQEKTPTKRGLSLGYGYSGYPLSLGLDAYHAPLEAYHAPLEAYHAPLISQAPIVSHAPLISHAPALPYHAPLAYSSPYSSPYFGYGHYPYFH